jgi:hypothetical protein
MLCLAAKRESFSSAQGAERLSSGVAAQDFKTKNKKAA